MNTEGGIVCWKDRSLACEQAWSFNFIPCRLLLLWLVLDVTYCIQGLSTWPSGKESTRQSSRRKSHEFNSWVGKILWKWHSCLGNSMDRGAWWATVHGITKELDTTERLNTAHGIQMPCYAVCVACAPRLTDRNSGNIHPASCSPGSQHQEPWVWWSVSHGNLSGLPYSVTESNSSLFWCCRGGVK